MPAAEQIGGQPGQRREDRDAGGRDQGEGGEHARNVQAIAGFSDAEGKASFDGAPYGKLRVQVLASGFQTFGADYDIDKPALEIMVKMKRPAGQYSIYEEHPGDKKDEENREPDSKEKPR